MSVLIDPTQTPHVILGERYDISSLKLIEVRGQTKRAVEKQNKVWRVNINPNERIISVYEPENTFSTILLVASLIEEQDG